MRPKRQRWLLPLALLFIFLMRVPSFSQMLLQADEAVYWTIGQDTAQGGIPYVTSWEHKGPFVYYVLAIPSYFFPSNLMAQRLFMAAGVLLTMVFFYRLMNLYVERLWSVIGAVGYGVAVSSFKDGLSTLPDGLCIFLLAPALYFFCRWDEGGRKAPRDLVYCGIFTSLVLLCKANTVLALIGIPLLLLKSPRRGVLKAMSWLALGVLLPIALCVGWFAILGNLRDFYLGYIAFNFQYVAEVPLEKIWERQWSLFTGPIQLAFLLIQVVAIGFIVLRRRLLSPQQRRLFFLLAATFAGSVASVVLLRHGFNYYYVDYLVAVGPLVALALKVLGKRWVKNFATAEQGLLLMLAGVATVELFLSSIAYTQRILQWREQPLMKVVEYIKTHTKPDDTILVIKDGAHIYYFANRMAPTRFFLWLDNKPDFRRNIIHDLGMETSADLLTEKPPTFIIVRRISLLDRFTEEQQSFIRSHYRGVMKEDKYRVYRYRPKGVKNSDKDASDDFLP